MPTPVPESGSRSARPLVFVIHHLNPWGGHERSTWEVVKRLRSKIATLRVVAYSWIDSDRNSFFRVWPNFRGPALFVMGYFLILSTWIVRVILRRQGTLPLVHATGTCTWASDVVQVQFINTAWKKKKAQFRKLGLFKNPSTRALNGGILRWFSLGLDFYHDLLLELNAFLEKKIYTKHKTYIAISNQVKQELFNEFGIEKNVHVIHHGVDSSAFLATGPEWEADRLFLRMQYGIKEGEILLLLVGEYERKGLAVAIEALALLPPAIRNQVRLLAVGHGDQRGFQKRAEDLGVADRLIFKGHEKTIHLYYRAADVFILPTYYEPFGLVILEAMASGLPVICSRDAGASELIRDGEDGLLIQDPSQPAEITAVIARLCSDPALRKKIGTSARKTAENHSWDKVAQDYEKVLLPLLEAPLEVT